MALTAAPAAPRERWRRLVPWPGWRQLPRDARDTLFLLGVIAWTVLPHASHLPVWCVLLTGAVLLWRAQLALSNGALPGHWVLVAVLALAVALTLWSYTTLLGKEPGITMVVVLMALKTLELRARRDAFVVFFLGFFLVLTQFLYSQSLAVAAAMLVAVWGLLTALVLAHMPVGQPSLRQAAALSARTALLGAPIMALLFVLFPRIAPLWGVPQDGLSTTGLSNVMRLGSVAELAQDDSVALRLRFDGAAPPPASLYLRGPVLARFDGSEWRTAVAGRGGGFASGLAGDFGTAPLPRNLRVNGAPVRYEMTLEPLRLTALPLLEATPEAPRIDGYRVRGRANLEWLTDRPVVERVRFDAIAYPAFRYGPTEPEPGLRELLALPEGYNPRTLAWAAALRHEPRLAQADARTLAQALLQRIRNGGYSYTLAPGAYGRDAIDEFWLDRREGFCEHFAAAFVVVMRALGVPARVVTGYQGADSVPLDGYYLVRQSSAHAWAEYWQQGVGWVRADPTAAVAPERIDGTRRLRPPPGLVAGAIGNVNPALLAELRDAWELVNNRWNQWVLSYSRSQQLDVLKSLGFRAPSWEDLALLLIAVLSTLALSAAAWAAWDRRRIDPWTRQRRRLQRALAQLELPAAAHDSLRTLAARVRKRFGARGEALAVLFERIEQQRYGRGATTRPDAALARAALAQARQLRSLPRG